MKKLVNYEYVDMTPEEVAEFEKNNKESVELPKRVTDKERISALESAIADLAILLSQNFDNEVLE